MSSLETRPVVRDWTIPSPRLPARTIRGRPSWVTTAVVSAAYALYAVFLTWPLATDPGGLLSGSTLYADLGGSVAQMGYLVQHHVFPFAPAVFHGINAPQGLTQPWVENLASFPGTALLVGLAYLFGAVASSAAFLWLSFVLSGVSMFLLARRLFGSVLAAALAGFAFAFFPWAVDKLNGHYQYMDGWVLVLAVWRGIELIDRPSVRNAWLAGAAAALAMWFTFYFMLIAGVGFATLAVLALIVGRARSERRLGVLAVSGLPVLGLLGALGGLAAVAGGAQTGAIRTQPVHELYAFSARPLEWLLPDRHNLLFGGLTRGYLTSHLHRSNFGESSLYLGLSVLVLAGLGAVMALRAVSRRDGQGMRDRPAVAALAGLALAVVAALFSLPPSVQVFGFPIAMPSSVVYRLTSTWRVYSRFVELLELGLCLLLAYAVSRLLAALAPRRAAALFALLGVVLVFDLWARPPVRTQAVTPPPEYVWLREHPRGTVADYPIFVAAYPEYHALFWQIYDGHPLFQGYASGSEAESMKLDMANLKESTTAGALAMLGVKYVVVHPGQPGAGPGEMRARGYILRFRSPHGSVWEVGAPAARTRVDGLDGFSSIRGRTGAEYRWAAGPAVLGVYARGCPACRATVTFMSASNKLPRLLTVTQAGRGGVLARVRIPVGRAIRVTVPDVTLTGGSARLRIDTDVPPSPFEIGYDPGPYSVYVGEPRLRLSGRARARRS